MLLKSDWKFGFRIGKREVHGRSQRWWCFLKCTHSVTRSLTHSLIHSLTHSLSVTHSFELLHHNCLIWSENLCWNASYNSDLKNTFLWSPMSKCSVQKWSYFVRNFSTRNMRSKKTEGWIDLSPYFCYSHTRLTRQANWKV